MMTPKSYESLIPSIEQRESAWVRVRERFAQTHPRTPLHPTLTLARQYGCEGYPLAERLKVLLEDSTGQLWNIYDKALVDKVVADEMVSRHLLSHLGDESHAQDVLMDPFGYHTHNEAYNILVRHLRQIAEAGCAIIVGRGGAVVCQDFPNCFHFRLIGSFGFRTASIAHRLDMPLEAAEAFVRRQSKLREKFLSHCLHTDITSPQWYDAVFNNERQGVEPIADACLSLVMRRWPDKGYFKRGSVHDSAALH
ncbi:MAG TPA: cytidylate kinase-like family protein [Geothrix sp.]|nr:cytidylate kinase-like family protein [Geothrix sp.]